MNFLILDEDITYLIAEDIWITDNAYKKLANYFSLKSSSITFEQYQLLDILFSYYGEKVIRTKDFQLSNFIKDFQKHTTHYERLWFFDYFRFENGRYIFIPDVEKLKSEILLRQKSDYSLSGNQQVNIAISEKLAYNMSHKKHDVEGVLNMDNLVPEIDEDYEAYGQFNLIKNIISSEIFNPVFISGDSGYGKTLGVEQACAQTERKLIRVPISRETDKSQLLVVPTLNNGNLVYENGPVLTAMEQGAVLLLDEIDRGSANLLCLNGILEGKPFYNEKTMKMVYPQKGFNVFATANSKGTGDTVKYLVNILDSALLERFVITIIQKAPPVKEEQKILENVMRKLDGALNSDKHRIINDLVNWANKTRESESNQTVEDSISTRRLVDIIKMMFITGDLEEAIKLCCNRFSDATKDGFVETFNAIHVKMNAIPELNNFSSPNKIQANATYGALTGDVGQGKTFTGVMTPAGVTS
jgi:AAA domain (dynein-related subfamily)